MSHGARSGAFQNQACRTQPSNFPPPVATRGFVPANTPNASDTPPNPVNTQQLIQNLLLILSQHSGSDVSNDSPNTSAAMSQPDLLVRIGEAQATLCDFVALFLYNCAPPAFGQELSRCAAGVSVPSQGRLPAQPTLVGVSPDGVTLLMRVVAHGWWQRWSPSRVGKSPLPHFLDSQFDALPPQYDRSALAELLGVYRRCPYLNPLPERGVSLSLPFLERHGRGGGGSGVRSVGGGGSTIAFAASSSSHTPGGACEGCDEAVRCGGCGHTLCRVRAPGCVSEGAVITRQIQTLCQPYQCRRRCEYIRKGRCRNKHCNRARRWQAECGLLFCEVKERRCNLELAPAVAALVEVSRCSRCGFDASSGEDPGGTVPCVNSFTQFHSSSDGLCGSSFDYSYDREGVTR